MRSIVVWVLLLATGGVTRSPPFPPTAPQTPTVPVASTPAVPIAPSSAQSARVRHRPLRRSQTRRPSRPPATTRRTFSPSSAPGRSPSSCAPFCSPIPNAPTRSWPSCAPPDASSGAIGGMTDEGASLFVVCTTGRCCTLGGRRNYCWFRNEYGESFSIVCPHIVHGNYHCLGLGNFLGLSRLGCSGWRGQIHNFFIKFTLLKVTVFGPCKRPLIFTRFDKHDMHWWILCKFVSRQVNGRYICLIHLNLCPSRETARFDVKKGSFA